MGACDFEAVGMGKTAADAFDSAVREAQYMHGHGGYTGTIAEKNSFTEITVPEGRNAYEYAQDLMDEHDDRVMDKWGPAGCVKVGEGKYYFFGIASQ